MKFGFLLLNLFLCVARLDKLVKMPCSLLCRNFEFGFRVEVGATMLEHVFIAKGHVEGRQITLKGKFHLLVYLVIRLGKILVRI